MFLPPLYCNCKISPEFDKLAKILIKVSKSILHSFKILYQRNFFNLKNFIKKSWKILVVKLDCGDKLEVYISYIKGGLRQYV